MILAMWLDKDRLPRAYAVGTRQAAIEEATKQLASYRERKAFVGDYMKANAEYTLVVRRIRH